MAIVHNRDIRGNRGEQGYTGFPIMDYSGPPWCYGAPITLYTIALHIMGTVVEETIMVNKDGGDNKEGSLSRKLEIVIF